MFQQTYAEITRNLYLGDREAVQYFDRNALIVNCTNEVPFPANCTNCIRIPVNDDPRECDHLLALLKENAVLEKIHQALLDGKVVLIHCFAGIQRSAAVTACYLMKYYGIEPISAINYIQSKRPVAFYHGANFMNAMNRFYEQFR
jgi:protein-tyrosine phosphatase